MLMAFDLLHLSGKDYRRMVAKDPESAYTSGRTLKWLKVKQSKYRGEEPC